MAAGSDDAKAVAKRLKAAREAFVDVVDYIAAQAKADPNAAYAGSVPYLLLTGNLDEHLKEIGDTAQEIFDQLVEQMKKAEGVTERLKTENQMEWVGRMNSICSRAEEVVLSELVYC